MMSSEALKSIISVALGNPNVEIEDNYGELTDIEKIACRYYCCSAMTLTGAYKVAEEAGFPEAPAEDEKFLRTIESKVGVSEKDSSDFRKSIVSFVGNLFLKQKEISWDMNPQLAEAFMKYHKEQIEKN